MNGRCLSGVKAPALAVVILLAAGGCSQSTTSAPRSGDSQSTTSAPWDGNTPAQPLTPADLAGWRLERREDQPVWEFTDTRFVLTNRGRPAGAKVFEAEVAAVLRFEGEWRLSEDRRTLRLRHVAADGQLGKVPDAALPVEIVGLAFINLGPFQYQRPLSQQHPARVG